MNSLQESCNVSTLQHPFLFKGRQMRWKFVRFSPNKSYKIYEKKHIYIYNNTCSVAKLWNGSKVFSYWKVNNVWNPNSYKNQNVQNGLTQALIFHEDVWFNFMFFYQSAVDSTHDKGASVSLYKCPTHPIAKVTSFFGRKPYRSDLVGSPNIAYFVFVYLKKHDPWCLVE